MTPVGLAVHPSANYVVAATADANWHFLDVSRSACLKVVTAAEHDTIYSSCTFHPDGLILGTGTTAGTLKIWDVREQKNVSSIKEHSGSINTIAFSENGYLAATGSNDGTVKIWDLRKLISTKALEVGSPVSAVNFDYSGVYLGIGAGNQVQVKVVKDFADSVVSFFFRLVDFCSNFYCFVCRC